MSKSAKHLRIHKKYDGWVILAIVLTLFVTLPIIALFFKAFTADQTIFKGWAKSGILWDYTWRTIVLMFSVGGLAAIIGVAMAWVVAYCRFPLKKYLDFLTLFPFVMPAWIAAWCWKDILDYAGPWHKMIKWLASLGLPLEPNKWIIPINNLAGASFILAFSAFPYVYLLCRTAFKQQSASLFESARSLHATPFQAFYRVSLPLVRPALAAGILVVMMEVLNDFGTVKYFGIPVLSLGIEDAWINRSSPGAAAALSMFALLIALILVSGEQLSRARIRNFAQNESYREVEAYHFSGLKGWLVSFLFFLPIFIGFIVPFIVVFKATLRRIGKNYDWSRIIEATFTSISLAFLASIFAVIIACLLVWAAKNSQTKSIRLWVRLSSLGYAIPGMVLATGILMPAGIIDKFLPFGITIVGSSALLIYGWVARYLSLAIGNMDAGFSRVRSSMVDSGRSLGFNPLSILFRIYIPLLRSFMLTAGIMVFIDSLKELPIALLARPFNMELLSLYVWQYGSMEQLEEAAPGSLILIVAGIIPILILWRRLSRVQPK
ncbi:MAG: ABC transporter permease [Alphaproteobacteria bacterium]